MMSLSLIFIKQTIFFLVFSNRKKEVINMKNVDDDDDKYKFSQNQNVNGSFICVLADVCVCVFRMQIYRPKNIKLIFEFFYLEKKSFIDFCLSFSSNNIETFLVTFSKNFHIVW